MSVYLQLLCLLVARLYAMFLMYGCELIAMKEGLNDVIPPELLSGLTAEVHVCACTLCVSQRTCNVTSD